MNKVLFIEDCNYENFPMGGQLTFARQMLSVFGNELVLAGISTDKTNIGRWRKKVIDGVEYDFFPYAFLRNDSRRPFVPNRVKTYFGLRQHKFHIMNAGVKSIFLSSQHLMLEVANWKFDSLCYYFPGVENPLTISRFPWAKPMATFFDHKFLPAVNMADTILAASDYASINELYDRSKKRLNPTKIISFPTRVDTDVFHQIEEKPTKMPFGLPDDKKIFITTGRLHWAKGWRLVLAGFIDYLSSYRDATLVFVGDGEERHSLESEINRSGLGENVIVLGQKNPIEVAQLLQLADLYVFGSEREGWSTSLVEALACGLPIVTTDFSSAKEIVKDGKNGYVVNGRDARSFSECMHKALYLDGVQAYNTLEVEKYSLRNLRGELERVWAPLR